MGWEVGLTSRRGAKGSIVTHTYMHTQSHTRHNRYRHDPTVLPEPPNQMPLRTVGAVFVVNGLLLLLPLGTPLAFTSITSVCTIGAQVLL